MPDTIHPPSPEPTVAEPSDVVLDAIASALTDTPESPSNLARKAHVTTREAHAALAWLGRKRMVVSVGNGCWTRYRNRQFGELVAAR